MQVCPTCKGLEDVVDRCDMSMILEADATYSPKMHTKKLKLLE